MENSLFRFNTSSLFVFIDLETFSLNLSFCHNRPWQIAMMKVKGDAILESYDRYVKWDTKLQISKRAAEVTHFDPMKFEQEAVAPETVYPTMKEWLDSADYIIGHNVLGFDIYLIKEWYRMNGDNPEHLFNKVIDTNCLAKAIKLKLPAPSGRSLLEWQYPIMNIKQKGLKTNLKLCGEELNIEHDYANLHNALTDLGLNVKVWNKQKHSLEI